MFVTKRIVLSLGTVLVIFVAALVAVRAVNQHKVEGLASRIEAERRERAAIAEADREGGSTPQETLGLFAEALEKGDGTSAAALCVPALRDSVAQGIAGMSEKERRETAVSLRAVRAEPGDADVVTAAEPVYVELIKYPSGVWKVASF